MYRIPPKQPQEPITLDPQRCFSARQRAELFMRADGKCEVCGEKITGTWTAGHYPVPHAMGGPTILENGRVEGDACGCSALSHRTDTKAAAKAERQAGRKGQKARRVKNGPAFQHPYLRKLMNGKVVPREED